MAEFLERPISPNKISGRARVPAAGRRDECVAKLLAEKRELHRKKQRRMKMALEVVRGGEGRGKDEGRAFVM